MPCHQYSSKSCCQFREEQGSDHQGWGCCENQGVGAQRTSERTERNDCLRCSSCFVWWVPSQQATPRWLIVCPDDLKSQLLEMGICDVLIPLTDSPSLEVQGNSAAALGNLSMKGTVVSLSTSSY
jgi:hypothetical protein